MKKIPFITETELDHQLYDFKIIFAYHSGKIENDKITFHDTRDIFENGSVKGYTGDLKTLMEIQNQKICYEYIKPYIVKRKPIDLEFVKKVHYLLTRGTYDEFRYKVRQERPGEFKKHDYVTGVNEVGCPPEMVEDELKDLLLEIQNVSDEQALVAGAYFHARFENIHPFADGNGRVGRTLMNYYFMIHGIAPIVIHNEYKRLYYDVLEKYDVEEELEPLIKFIEFESEKTWTKCNDEKKKALSNFLEDNEKDEWEM